MKLDTTALRYLTNEDWRVLTAVEIGSKNHEVVPTPLIIQLSHLRSGSGVHKSISTLAKANLIARTKNAKYDGYRLTYGGLDYLALHTHLRTSTLYSTGNCIGVGKESDIYACAPPPPSLPRCLPPTTVTTTTTHAPHEQVILKIHRLGRISFRTIKSNRDYLGRHRTSASWMYMSRLSAQKEFTFMTALYENKFPVPRPIAQSRHTVVMEMVADGVPLRSVRRLGSTFDDARERGIVAGGGDESDAEDIEEEEESGGGRKSDPVAVGALYARLLALIVSLAEHGLIHGDFNEFNILISPPAASEPNEPNEPSKPYSAYNPPLQPKITLIDFPQTLSTSHPNASFYFDRDVACIKTFFQRRFGFTSAEPGPFLSDVATTDASDPSAGGKGSGKKRKGGVKRLDVEVEASGFSRKMAKELEGYRKEVGVDGGEGADGDGEMEEESEEDGSEFDGSTEAKKQDEEDRSDPTQRLNEMSIKNG